MSNTNIHIAGKGYHWKSGTWEPNDGTGLRVFRFRGDAWRCRGDVVSCYVETELDGVASKQTIAISGYEGRALTGEETYSEIISAWLTRAERLSTWGEWFEKTIGGAAHAYLDAMMAEHRRRLMREAFQLGVAVREMGEVQMARDLVDFGSSAYGSRLIDSELVDYLRLVKTDLEARLRGEPGSVVLP